MIKKTSLKFRLLLYYLLIQIVLFIVFGAVLFHLLNDSVKDTIQRNLKVVILDIKDDLIDYHKDFKNFFLDKELVEFEIKPTYIRIVKNDEVIKTENFPKNLKLDKNIVDEKIYFDIEGNIAFSTLKFEHGKNTYIIQLATLHKQLSELFPNLKYIVIIIVPIILLLATIFGNILISKSFKPIENLLKEIKIIGAKSLSNRVTVYNEKDEVGQISKEINHLLQRIEEAYEQISQFTSDASHELKTPLTILRGEMEVLLKEERSTKEYKSSLNSLLDEVLNIQKIVENLLLLAKVENKSLNYDDVYLDEVIYDVVHDLEKLAKRKNITISTKVNEPFTFKANEELIKIVLKNLIENSIFYSFENSSINIKLVEGKDSYKVFIEDFGIGMGQKDLSNIFEKFYRSDSSRSKNTGGFGLGMAIVKRICDLYEIKIDIKSELQKGTTFELCFKTSSV